MLDVVCTLFLVGGCASGLVCLSYKNVALSGNRFHLLNFVVGEGDERPVFFVDCSVSTKLRDRVVTSLSHRSDHNIFKSDAFFLPSWIGVVAPITRMLSSRHLVLGNCFNCLP